MAEAAQAGIEQSTYLVQNTAVINAASIAMPPKTEPAIVALSPTVRPPELGEGLRELEAGGLLEVD
jgi:hypothetical protein